MKFRRQCCKSRACKWDLRKGIKKIKIAEILKLVSFLKQNRRSWRLQLNLANTKRYSMSGPLATWYSSRWMYQLLKVTWCQVSTWEDCSWMVQLLKDSQSLDICPTWHGCSLMGQLLKDTQCLVIYLFSFAWLQLNMATTKRYPAHGHLSSLAWFQRNGATTKRYLLQVICPTCHGCSWMCQQLKYT